MVPIETELRAVNIEAFKEDGNNKVMRLELNIIDETKADASTRLTA